jgi:DHA2 family integral membrane protein (MFS transporter)
MDQEAIHNRRWAILGVLMVCLLVVVLDNTILNVALRTIQEDLGASQSQMQWAIDSYALVFAGLLITWGVLGDRLGRKKILLFGMAAFGATSLLCSFAHSPAQLILFRALMGIGAAAVQPQTLSIIQNVFDPSERGRAIGIWAAAAGSGIAIGPLAGGLLLKYFWWGSVFLVNVPIVIIGVIGISLLVPDSKDPRPNKLDPLGVVLSMVGLVLLVYGIISGGNTNDWVSWKSLGAIIAGLLVLALFVFLERRSTHPTIDMSLFKKRAFTAGSASIGLTFFALMGATFFLSYFMQAVRGYTPLAAGTALLAVAVAQLIAAPQSARLVDRFGVRVVTGGGLLLASVAMVAYGFMSEGSPQWAIEVIMFAQGAGMGFTMAPATNAIMSAVPRDKAGAGAAVNNTVRQVAGALGVAVLGSLLAVSFRTHLGSDAPSQLASKLDQPAAVVSKLPPEQQVTPLVTSDTAESIGNSLEFAQGAVGALQTRAAHAPAGSVTAEQKQAATSAIGGFVQDSKDSFVSAMHITTFAAGIVNLIGAAVAFIFLPGTIRRRPQGAAGVPSAEETAEARAAAAAGR